MCSQYLSVLHWIIHWYLLSTISSLLKNYSLVEVVDLFIRCNKTKFRPSNIFLIFKNQKIPGFYMHTDISKTVMIFEAKISLHEVTKSINSQTNNKSSMA